MNVVRGAARALVVKLLGQSLYVGYFVFLARVLDREGFGTVNFVDRMLNLLVPIVFLGFDSVAVKFAAVYWAEHDLPRLRGVLRTSRLVSLVACGCLLGLAAAVYAVLAALGRVPASLAGGAAAATAVSLLLLPLYAWIVLDREIQRGMRLLVRALFGFHVLRPLLAIVLTAVAGLFLSLNAATVLAILAVAMLIVAQFDGAQLRRAIGHGAPALYDRRGEWRAAAKPLVLSKIMYTVMTRADTVMVGYLVSLADAGAYAAAYRLASLTTFVLDGVRVAITPQVSLNYHRQRLDLVQQQVTQGSQLIVLGALPFLVMFTVAPGLCLNLFGHGYRSAAPLLVILALGQFVNAATGTVSPLLTMTSLQSSHARVVTICALVYLPLMYLATRTYGVIGAAAATSAILALSNVWMVGIARTKLGVASYVRFPRGSLAELWQALRAPGSWIRAPRGSREDVE